MARKNAGSFGRGAGDNEAGEDMRDDAEESTIGSSPGCDLRGDLRGDLRWPTALENRSQPGDRGLFASPVESCSTLVCFDERNRGFGVVGLGLIASRMSARVIYEIKWLDKANHFLGHSIPSSATK